MAKKVNKKDSRLWHIAKKYRKKKLGSARWFTPTKLSEDGMLVTLTEVFNPNWEGTFNMQQLCRFLNVPHGGKYEFQDLPHKGE